MVRTGLSSRRLRPRFLVFLSVDNALAQGTVATDRAALVAALQRHRWRGLDEQHQLVEQRAALVLVRSYHGCERPSREHKSFQ